MTVADSGWGVLPKPASQLPFLGNDAMEKLVRDYSFESVLDIGCGAGDHAEHLRSRGKRVTTLDAGHYHTYEPDILGMYEDVEFSERFDCIWMSHILEHVRNVGFFLDKVYDDLKDEGIVAVTVPPLKHNLVGGHINLFNPATLVYQLVQAGFDCSRAPVKVYGYNISVIATKSEERGPSKGDWTFDDVARYFPFEARQNIDGRILATNWD